jgi:dUTP pyrophosphatase
MKISLDNGAFMPIRAHELDAGIDLMTPICFTVPAHGFAFVDTGVHVELPPSTRGHVCSKSGLNKLVGITCDGTIDEGYTGSIGVTLHNDSDDDYRFIRGNKVAQLVVEPILRPTLEVVEKVSGGERGDDGFGSTGA